MLYSAGELIPYVYFPAGSFISLVTPSMAALVEVGLAGNEGMLGITFMLGVNIGPFHALVQGAGPALRTTAPSFSMNSNRALRCSGS